MPPTSATPCPSADDLLALLEGAVPRDASARIVAHAVTCSACASIIAGLGSGSAETGADTSTPGPDPRESRVLGRGSAVGRYLILSRIGRGGMGEVYAAYDPELDRKVALKLLHTAQGTHLARRRMLREARALGKLSHPGVVQVYDVGEHRGDVFVAMELVEGQSLDAWCAGPPRPGWKEIVTAYADAARGLAAAHETGMVHRDVKPSNILRGTDGRVRVADFGLAAARGAADAEPAPRRDPDLEVASSTAETLPAPSDSTSDQSTFAGALVGTPRYMAPEQIEGDGVGPGSDQFSLCTALHEALYGALPFRADDGPGAILDVLARKDEGPPESPPAGTEVPSWVYAVVARGLAPKPEDRFPSMTALADALERDPAARPRPWRLGVAIAAGGALIAGLAAAFGSGALANPCAHPERQLAGAWDDGVRSRVRAALVGAGRAYGEDTAQRVGQALDAYAASWSAMRGEVCEASRKGGQRREIVALRDECLDRRLGQLQALATLVAERPDVEVLDRAVQAASSLPPIASCADVEALTARVRLPEDPALRVRVAELTPKVNRAGALFEAGKYKEGRLVAEAALADLTGVDYAPLRAQAQYWLGVLQDGAADYEVARVSLRDAAVSAGEGRDEVLASAAWSRLLLVIGERLRRFDEAAMVESLAPAMARARDARSQASWLSARGIVMQRSAKYAEARLALERARDLLTGALGQDHVEVATVLNALGNLHYDVDEYDEARAAHERALEVREKALGREHPLVGESLRNIGNALFAQGDNAGAQAAYEKALAVHERALGPDHPSVASDLGNLAYVLAVTGAHADARGASERALSIYEKAFGRDHPKVGRGLINLGAVHYKNGELSRAREVWERAVATLEKALGPEHADLAMPLSNLADAVFHLGDYDDARQKLLRAIGIWEKNLGPENAKLGYALDTLGALETEAGDPRLGATHCARALAIREKALGAEHALVASTLTCLGRARVRLGELDGARAILERALRIADKTAGRSRVGLAAPLLGLGDLALAAKKPEDAVPLLERALALHDPENGASIELALAEALHRAGSDPARARALAETARATFERTGQRRSLERAARWLAEHP